MTPETFENQLQAFRPAPIALSRDRVVFAAGEAAERRRQRPWRIAERSLMAASLLLVLLPLRPVGHLEAPAPQAQATKTSAIEELLKQRSATLTELELGSPPANAPASPRVTRADVKIF